MRDFFNDLKKNILCRRTRNKMLSAYLSNEYFGFDDNLHASSCINVRYLEIDTKPLKKS